MVKEREGMKDSPIGQVVATERQPSTAYEFHFWIPRGVNIGIGSIVKVVTDSSTIFGIVTEAFSYNDVPGALADVLSREGIPGRQAPTERPEVRLFKAAVLRRIPEEPVTAVGIGEVYKAVHRDVFSALGSEGYEARGIPMGVYGYGDDLTPVLADPEHLLGPESAHLNVSGTSGLATKTSYILFLLQSIFQRYSGGDGVAAVLFNVKGGDLLFLDQEPLGEYPSEHRRLYEVCGLSPKPFEDVVYWAPFTDETASEVATLRNHPDLNRVSPVQGFCYGLKDILENADVVLTREDLDAKADAFLQYLAQEVAGRPHKFSETGEECVVKTLHDLVRVLQDILRQVEAKALRDYASHHPATIRKMYNRLNNIAVRYPGLVSHTGERRPPLPEKFTPNSVHVIDVAQLDAEAQDLVFAAVIADLRERMERRELGVGRLIVFVDELNKFAPREGRETHIVRALRDIAARGRYMNLVLFSAQQFRSRVDPEIIGNSTNAAFGHIQMEELASPIYSVYSRAVREKLGSSSPGEMMVRHPHFGQPVFLRFPLPYVMKGSDGIKKFPPGERMGWRQRLEQLAGRKSGGKITPAQVGEFWMRVPEGEREECAKRALQKLVELENEGEEAVARILRESFPRLPAMEPVSRAVVDDPEDPFASS
jgi:hypothetical protein